MMITLPYSFGEETLLKKTIFSLNEANYWLTSWINPEKYKKHNFTLRVVVNQFAQFSHHRTKSNISYKLGEKQTGEISEIR
jgi:hypothetical protein